MNERELIWRKERVGCITSSALPKLCKTGRTKGQDWGDTAIKYMYEKRYERINHKPIRNEDNANFRWGREQEPYAIAWLRENTMWEILHCSEDLDKIVFIKPFKGVGFGDSPDFYVMEENGKIQAVGEIKCLVSQSKFEEASLSSKWELIEEYKEQLAGHFIAHPNVNRLIYFLYDGKAEEDDMDELDELDPKRGLIIEYTRDELSDIISFVESKIKAADILIDKSIELGVKIQLLISEGM